MKLVLFLLFPFIELYSLIRLSDYISGLGVIAYVFLCAMIGMWILRHYGSQSLLKVQQELAQGRVPQEVMLENFMVFGAGLLLVFPGVLSTVTAAILLVPFCRTWIAKYVINRLAAHQSKHGNTAFFTGNGMFFYSTSTGFSRPGQAQHDDHSDEVVIDCVVEEVEPEKAGEQAELLFDCTESEADVHYRTGGSDPNLPEKK